MMKTDEKMIINGKRLDGRKLDEIREMKMEVGVIPNANGSAKVSFGKTTAIATVYGPRELFPRHLQQSGTGIIQFKYDMATFSVDERKRPGPSRRETEISKVARLGLENQHYFWKIILKLQLMFLWKYLKLMVPRELRE